MSSSARWTSSAPSNNSKMPSSNLLLLPPLDWPHSHLRITALPLEMPCRLWLLPNLKSTIRWALSSLLRLQIRYLLKPSSKSLSSSISDRKLSPRRCRAPTAIHRQLTVRIKPRSQTPLFQIYWIWSRRLNKALEQNPRRKTDQSLVKLTLPCKEALLADLACFWEICRLSEAKPNNLRSARLLTRQKRLCQARMRQLAGSKFYEDALRSKIAKTENVARASKHGFNALWSFKKISYGSIPSYLLIFFIND